MITIKENNLYLCIDDVVMDCTEVVAYTKGKIYRSENNGSITDNDGDTRHHISDDFATEYFIDIKDVFKSHVKNSPMIQMLEANGISFKNIMKTYIEYKINHIPITADKACKLDLLFTDN